MTGKELGIEGLTLFQALTTVDAVGDWIMDITGGIEGFRSDEKNRYNEGDIDSHGEYLQRFRGFLHDYTPGLYGE